MSWVRFRSGSFQINFRFQGKERNFTLGQVSQAEADAKVAHVDYLLMRLKQGLIELPVGVDVVSFVEQDGKVEVAVKAANRRTSETLGSLRDRYLTTHEGAQERKTLYTIGIHFRHLTSTLGECLALSDLGHADLQRHINRRAARGLAPVTIKKEISTLRAAWNWGRRSELIATEWPGRGLIYKKTTDKPPFQTKADIERQIAAGGLSAEQRKELWESLYLEKTQIEEVLEIVRENATHPWIHPMTCAAAYTGARRSELMRMLTSDVDFAAGVVTIREKKRIRGRTTSRRVPLAKALAEVLANYIAGRTDGSFLFCQVGTVERSKKRSATTGHKEEKTRPSGGKARKATVRDRELPPVVPLTEKEAHDHLKRTLAKSPWKVMRGWHVLRHSFISACASKGIDNRLIQSWCGHMSAEMTARYTHLYPSVQQTALDSVFG